MGTLIHNTTKGQRKRKKLMNEINVTPMVDVMLVLLIIFMITSPMLVAGINVDLPKTTAAPISSEIKPLVISINNNAEIFLFETKIKVDLLIEKLNEITKQNKETRIFIKGDKNIPYGKIIEIMSLIQNAGFTKVALISDIKHQ